MSAFRYILRAVEEFRKLDSQMPAQTMAYFLVIAERAPEDVSMKDLAGLVGQSQSSVSRNMQCLGKVWKVNKPGLDLVETFDDAMDRRRKLIRLTPKGRRVAESLRQAIGGV